MTGTEVKLRLVDNISIVVTLAVLMLATGLVAGLYPALYLSSFKPLNILRGINTIKRNKKHYICTQKISCQPVCNCFGIDYWSVCDTVAAGLYAAQRLGF
jgi:hypothetical protein